jgi:hypothetical protein
MDRKELLDMGWQLSQDLAKLLNLQQYKQATQEQINDVQNHLDVVELLLSRISWRA